MNFVDIIRTLFFFIDGIVYKFMGMVYNLLMQIANTSIFTEEIIDLFASKVYALLGIFMLFKVSFSIMTYIVNPDEFADKSKGFSKLITNIVITLTLLIFTPWIFSQAMDIQRIILKDNIIGKIFSTQASNNFFQGTDNTGTRIAYKTFKTFYQIDTAKFPACLGIELDDENDAACRNELGLSQKNYDKYIGLLRHAEANENIDGNRNYELLNHQKSSWDPLNGKFNIVNALVEEKVYIMSYTPVVSTIVGGFMAWILIIFCFDIAVRSVKLGFLRMIAPIPIISRIDPKGKGIFDKWTKSCISTYLDLFIRLLAIFFVLFVIEQVFNMEFVSQTTGLPMEVNMFTKIFIIMGALLFAKQLPKLLQDLTGAKLDGKFTLNPLKKIEEVPILGKPASQAMRFTGRTAKTLGAFTGNKAKTGIKNAAKKFDDNNGNVISGTFNDMSAWRSKKSAEFNTKHPELAATLSSINQDAAKTAYSMSGGVINLSGKADKLDEQIKIREDYSKFKSRLKDQADFDTTDLTSVDYDLNDAVDKKFMSVLSDRKNSNALVDSAKKGTKAIKQYYEDLKNSGTATMEEINTARELWEASQQYVISKANGIKMNNGDIKKNVTVQVIKEEAARFVNSHKDVLVDHVNQEGKQVIYSTSPNATYDDINMAVIDALNENIRVQATDEYKNAVIRRNAAPKKK